MQVAALKEAEQSSFNEIATHKVATNKVAAKKVAALKEAEQSSFYI